MSTLNKLPDGSPSPIWRVKAIGRLCEELKTVDIQEWWCDGKLVESVEDSAQDYFYGEAGFDKSSFKITSVVKL